MSFLIRRATPADVPEILRMIWALARYERQLDTGGATENSLRASLFGDAPQVFAEVADLGGRTVGLALWLIDYSTWPGRQGIYLEDLFVEPDARRRGVARALFTVLAREARDRGLARIDWSVLDWNESAMDFYRSLGGRRGEDWELWRLEGAALAALAN